MICDAIRIDLPIEKALRPVFENCAVLCIGVTAITTRRASSERSYLSLSRGCHQPRCFGELCPYF